MKRVTLITGGTRGIGLGIARSLAAEGMNLALCGRRNEKDVQNVLEELRGNNVDVLYLVCDISDTNQRAAMLDAIRETFGRLDVLVNNAGMAPPERRDILEASEENYELVMRVNLQGPYFLTQAAAGWMIEQGKSDPDFRGCIVNITSISAKLASKNRGEYCISKAGLSMASQLWAIRLAEFGINVYEIQPGLVETDMTAGIREKYDEQIQAGLIPQHRWGQPADIGKAVAMLLRGEMPYSTGAVLPVDGGMMLRRL
ncbi:MAG: 3-ketoacyl-ACP reductase [Phycisphaerae bacterium]|nr:3-ketoacyl-ACP reductase [Phycisphaerae bacterium]